MDFLKSKCRQEEERDHGVDCLLSHVLLGDIDGRKRRFHIGTKRHVVKADDAYIFGDADASFFDSLHSTCGDQVIVGKVTAGKLLKGLEILIFHFCCRMEYGTFVPRREEVEREKKLSNWKEAVENVIKGKKER